MAELSSTCAKCGKSLPLARVIDTRSDFFLHGKTFVCKGCANRLIKENQANWEIANRLCQLVDIPFDPKKWDRIAQINPYMAFETYYKNFCGGTMETANWIEHNKRVMEAEAKGRIAEILPEIQEALLEDWSRKWGANYAPEELEYLNDLLEGMMRTQNIAGALQEDQAEKLCKISLSIDQKIRGGEDFDKLISSYDKLAKAANITPKNVKNNNDFDSVGEIFAYLERKGFQNEFYNGETRDEVDNTMKNVQSYLRRLYVEESSIPEEVDRKVEQLKAAKELEREAFDYEVSREDAEEDGLSALEELEEFSLEV